MQTNMCDLCTYSYPYQCHECNGAVTADSPSTKQQTVKAVEVDRPSRIVKPIWIGSGDEAVWEHRFA